MNSLEAPAQKSKKRPTHRLLGCLIGCGGFLALVILALCIIGWWLLAPGYYIPPERFIPRNADGFLIVEIDVNDAGISALLRAIESEMMRAKQGQLPEDAPKMLRTLVQLQQRQQIGWLQSMVPRAMGCIWRTKANGEVTESITLHLRKFGGLARALLYLTARHAETTYAGKHKIVVADSMDYLSIVGGTMLIANDVELMRGMLARADADVDTVSISQNLKAIYDALKPDSDVTAVFKSDKAVLRDHFAQLGKLLIGRDYRNSELSKRTDAMLLTIAVISNALGYGVDIKSANKCVGKLIADTPYAPQCSNAIASFLTSWQDALRKRGMEFQFSIRTSTNRVIVPFTLSGIKILSRQRPSTGNVAPIVIERNQIHE